MTFQEYKWLLTMVSVKVTIADKKISYTTKDGVTLMFPYNMETQHLKEHLAFIAMCIETWLNILLTKIDNFEEISLPNIQEGGSQ